MATKKLPLCKSGCHPGSLLKVLLTSGGTHRCSTLHASLTGLFSTRTCILLTMHLPHGPCPPGAQTLEETDMEKNNHSKMGSVA